jgi:hypothetical protein
MKLHLLFSVALTLVACLFAAFVAWARRFSNDVQIGFAPLVEIVFYVLASLITVNLLASVTLMIKRKPAGRCVGLMTLAAAILIGGLLV